MHERLRIGQLLHERARTARMVEVHVRQQEIIDRRARDAELIQRSEQVGNGGVRSHIDEGRPSLIDDQVRGGVPGIEILCIDCGDAVRMSIECRLHSCAQLHVHIVPRRLA